MNEVNFFRNFVNKSCIVETVKDRQREEIERKQKWKRKNEEEITIEER